jgi:mono/diheme cytochrome c family protein
VSAARPGLLLAAIAAGLLGCSAEGDRPGYEFLPGMVRSGTVHAYDTDPVTKSGPALRLPPEGTVPVGWTAFAYGPAPEEAKRAGLELANPFSPTPEHLARGKQVFDSICFVCHGPRGEGDGPIIGRFPNPPSLLALHARTLRDGQIYHIITRGQGIMPSHAAQVRPDDRWRAILWVRQLQRSASEAAVASGPATATAGDAK